MMSDSPKKQQNGRNGLSQKQGNSKNEQRPNDDQYGSTNETRSEKGSRNSDQRRRDHGSGRNVNVEDDPIEVTKNTAPDIPADRRSRSQTRNNTSDPFNLREISPFSIPSNVHGSQVGKYLADQIRTWYDKFFGSVIVIASLGAGFTFSLTLSPPAQPNNDLMTSEDVTLFLALSWLFFVLAVAFSSTLQLGFALYTDSIEKQLERRSSWVFLMLNFISWFVQSLVLLGFFFASFSIAAYQKNVGYSALALTGFFMLVLITPIIYQIVVGRHAENPIPYARLMLPDWGLEACTRLESRLKMHLGLPDGIIAASGRSIPKHSI